MHGQVEDKHRVLEFCKRVWQVILNVVEQVFQETTVVEFSTEAELSLYCFLSKVLLQAFEDLDSHIIVINHGRIFLVDSWS